jgi:hypothetical protein
VREKLSETISSESRSSQQRFNTKQVKKALGEKNEPFDSRPTSLVPAYLVHDRLTKMKWSKYFEQQQSILLKVLPSRRETLRFLGRQPWQYHPRSHPSSLFSVVADSSS